MGGGNDGFRQISEQTGSCNGELVGNKSSMGTGNEVSRRAGQFKYSTSLERKAIGLVDLKNVAIPRLL